MATLAGTVIGNSVWVEFLGIQQPLRASTPSRSPGSPSPSRSPSGNTRRVATGGGGEGLHRAAKARAVRAVKGSGWTEW